MGSKPMAVRTARWAIPAMLPAAFLAGLAPTVWAASAVTGDQPIGQSADSLPVATDTRLGGDDAQTRFVMDLTRKIDLRVFTLADPYRVVVDIPQVTFTLPANAG